MASRVKTLPKAVQTQALTVLTKSKDQVMQLLLKARAYPWFWRVQKCNLPYLMSSHCIFYKHRVFSRSHIKQGWAIDIAIWPNVVLGKLGPLWFFAVNWAPANGALANLHGVNYQIIQHSEKEKMMTDKWTDRQTDRISYLRLDPFCGRGRVKTCLMCALGHSDIRRRKKIFCYPTFFPWNAISDLLFPKKNFFS